MDTRIDMYVYSHIFMCVFVCVCVCVFVCVCVYHVRIQTQGTHVHAQVCMRRHRRACGARSTRAVPTSNRPVQYSKYTAKYEWYV